MEHLLNALAACVTTSMVAHAAARGIHIEALESELEGDIDLCGFLGLSNDVPKGFTEIRVNFKVKTDVNNHRGITMASGWAKDGAEQRQSDDTVEDALRRIRSRLPQGESLTHCEECGEAIPEARRQALAGVRLCVVCQTERDEVTTAFSSYNRRGSKDSQLR